MNIPNIIKIGATTYEVELLEHWPGKEEGDFAEYDPRNNKIFLDNSLPHNQLELAFLHEIFHAINSELDEFQVDALAFAMHGILNENNLCDIPHRGE